MFRYNGYVGAGRGAKRRPPRGTSMSDRDSPTRKTYDRLQAMDRVMSTLESKEAPAGECPKCANILTGFRRTSDQKFEGVVRCKKCGYFYVVRA